MAFLFGHVGDNGGRSGPAENAQLPFINSNGPVFSGVVDPDHPLEQVFTAEVAGQAGGQGGVAPGAYDFLQSMREAANVPMAKANE